MLLWRYMTNPRPKYIFYLAIGISIFIVLVSLLTLYLYRSGRLAPFKLAPPVPSPTPPTRPVELPRPEGGVGGGGFIPAESSNPNQ